MAGRMGKPRRDGIDVLIKGIIRDMDAGRPVAEIASRNGVDTDYVDDVLQIYTTHRGIDIQGIIDRLPEDML